MIFVDSWAWVALADRDDPYHAFALQERNKLQQRRERYATTNLVLAESIGLIFRSTDFNRASKFFQGLIEFFKLDQHVLIHITPDHFDRAWQLRLKFNDKPDISFVDFTSMVVMQELGINTVFTGDRHFEQVNLGFQLVP